MEYGINICLAGNDSAGRIQESTPKYIQNLNVHTFLLLHRRQECSFSAELNPSQWLQGLNLSVNPLILFTANILSFNIISSSSEFK